MSTLKPPRVKVQAYRAEEVSFGEPECGFLPDVRDVHLVTGNAYVVLQMPGRWEWLYLQAVEIPSTHELGCHYIDKESGYCYLWMHRREHGERQWVLVDQPLCQAEVVRIFEHLRRTRCGQIEVRVGVDRLQLEKIGTRPILVEC